MPWISRPYDKQALNPYSATGPVNSTALPPHLITTASKPRTESHTPPPRPLRLPTADNHHCTGTSSNSTTLSRSPTAQTSKPAWNPTNSLVNPTFRPHRVLITNATHKTAPIGIPLVISDDQPYTPLLIVCSSQTPFTKRLRSTSPL